MGVPFEALLPYAFMFGLTVFSGVALTGLKTMQSGGKWPRYNSDRWDRVMMDRDRRLTGFLRGQSDNPVAPDGFELTNAWKVSDRSH